MKINYLKTTFAGFIAAASIFVGNAIVSADSYTVQSGDTLSELAVTYSTSVDSIVSLNNIADANVIHVGQVLEIDADIDNDGQDTEAVSSSSEAVTSNEAATTSETVYTSTASGDEAAAKEEIARRESGGSYTAQNGQYYGRYQLTISYLNGDLSAENQERVADAYVASRYGSWTAALAFWNANGWY